MSTTFYNLDNWIYASIERLNQDTLVLGYWSGCYASPNAELILHPTESSLGKRVRLRMRVRPLEFNLSEFFLNMPPPQTMRAFRPTLSEESQILVRIALALYLGHLTPIVIARPKAVQPASLAGIVWISLENDLEALKAALDKLESPTQRVKLDAEMLGRAFPESAVKALSLDSDRSIVRYQKEQNKLRAKYHSRKR